MIKQNPKDPIWLVKLQIPVAHRGTTVLGPDGEPMATRPEYGEESEITVHAPDGKTAGAIVVQHNPGAKIIGAEKA